MTKPDRFERMVGKFSNRAMPDYDNHVIADHEVVKLLRQHHRAMVRMVKKVDAWSAQELAESDDIIAAILHQLKEYEK